MSALLTALNPPSGETEDTLRNQLAHEAARSDIECHARDRVEELESATLYAYHVEPMTEAELDELDFDRRDEVEAMHRAARFLLMSGAAIEAPGRPGWIIFTDKLP